MAMVRARDSRKRDSNNGSSIQSIFQSDLSTKHAYGTKERPWSWPQITTRDSSSQIIPSIRLGLPGLGKHYFQDSWACFRNWWRRCKREAYPRQISSTNQRLRMWCMGRAGDKDCKITLSRLSNQVSIFSQSVLIHCGFGNSICITFDDHEAIQAYFECIRFVLRHSDFCRLKPEIRHLSRAARNKRDVTARCSKYSTLLIRTVMR